MSFDSTAARDPLLTEEEAANLLSLSPSTLRLLRSREQINYYKLGRRVAYAMSHIEAFKQQHFRPMKEAA
jgi:excisionase family DNA binding protein